MFDFEIRHRCHCLPMRHPSCFLWRSVRLNQLDWISLLDFLSCSQREKEKEWEREEQKERDQDLPPLRMLYACWTTKMDGCVDLNDMLSRARGSSSSSATFRFSLVHCWKSGFDWLEGSSCGVHENLSHRTTNSNRATARKRNACCHLFPKSRYYSGKIERKRVRESEREKERAAERNLGTEINVRP